MPENENQEKSEKEFDPSSDLTWESLALQVLAEELEKAESSPPDQTSQSQEIPNWFLSDFADF